MSELLQPRRLWGEALLSSMDNYANHTAWSDPGTFAERLSCLPSEPLALANALEEFVIHHAAARSLGFGVPKYAESDRGLRTVTRLLGAVVDRDARPLSEHRDLPNYLYGTCHDFALIAASVFRSNGTQARLRVGFADYFRAGYWEDHWVCEYQTNGRWRLLDAQLGRRAREGHRIDFDVSDVPRSRFRSGPQVWRAIRSGEIDPATCGVSFAGISGEWFAASNVLKDIAALAAIEVLPWDYWGPSRAISENQSVGPDVAADFDAIAETAEPSTDSLADVVALYDAFPWAKPTETVASFAQGRFHEQAILPATRTGAKQSSADDR